MQTHHIKSPRLEASISPHGAELHSLLTPPGRQWLWQADAAIWPRHAPLLFPIVGRLKDDMLIHRGTRYPLKQHGFARDLPFTWLTRQDDHCSLQLSDSADTRRMYPFAFTLTVDYRIVDDTLTVSYRVDNPADEILPLSIGAHPAFCWPLRAEDRREDHHLVFEQVEAAPIRRLQHGLLQHQALPTPLQGNTLQLHDTLFEDDALIFDRPASRAISYVAPAGLPRIELRFADFPQLGIWTKPGAGFICLEPWQGYASPLDYEGEFSDKPGVVHIAPRGTRRWSYSIRVIE